MDYSIWKEILDIMGAGTVFNSLDELRAGIVAAWSRLTREHVLKAVATFPRRLAACESKMKLKKKRQAAAVEEPEVVE